MKRAALILLPVLAIVLELLPGGAVLRFALPPDTVSIETFSYFRLIPFGYANFAPFITAVLSCILLALAVTFAVTKSSKAKKALNLISVLSAIASLAPLLFGAECFTVIGSLISAILIAESLLAAIRDS